MNSRFLYHTWGLYSHKCTKEKYNYFTRRSKRASKGLSAMRSYASGQERVSNQRFTCLPIGGKKTVIRMKIQRYKCMNDQCGYDQQKRIPFATDSYSYTLCFARYVTDLLKTMSLKNTSGLLDVSWDTIKDTHVRYLERHYFPPSLEDVDSISIDEFAISKVHVYKTRIVDLRTGRILYVGDGKGANSLDRFWKAFRKKGVKIKYVATDLSAAFISSISEDYPDAVRVFDHFHVMKLMNAKLDKIHKVQYHMEKDVNRRKVLKGTRYPLLRNGANIHDKEYKTKLENVLTMNSSL